MSLLSKNSQNLILDCPKCVTCNIDCTAFCIGVAQHCPYFEENLDKLHLEQIAGSQKPQDICIPFTIHLPGMINSRTKQSQWVPKF